MKLVTAEEVHEHQVSELGLDAEVFDLSSIEAISAALRRAAEFLCPCGAKSLIRAVSGPLEGLVPDMDAYRERVEEILETLVAHGDLLEQRDIASEQGARAGVLL